MIIRGAIAAPFALGVFSSLMLIPGYAGFGASALCYVLMMATLAGRLPGRGGGEDYEDTADVGDAGSASLFGKLIAKTKTPSVLVAPALAFAKRLPAIAAVLLARAKSLLRRGEPGEPHEALPDVEVLVAELQDELVEEGVLPTDEPDGAETPIEDTGSPVEDEATEPEHELVGGRSAFFRRLVARLAKLPGIAYLLSLTVRLEVKRTPTENDAEPVAEVSEPSGDEALEEAIEAIVREDDFVDIDAVELGDKPSLADRVLKIGEPLVNAGAAMIAFARRLLRLGDGAPEPAGPSLEADDAPGAEDVRLVTKRAARPPRTVGQVALAVLIATLRVIGWTLLVIAGLAVFLADLVITAVRNRLAARPLDEEPAEAEAQPTHRGRIAETTPASLYGEYQEAA